MPGELMRAEMLEQPIAIQRTLEAATEDVRRAVELIGKKFLYATGSGTSYHASLVLQRALTRIANASTVAIPASELGSWVPDSVRGAVVVSLSQSGESVDTLSASRVFKSRGGQVIAITNTPGSSLSELADLTVLTMAGTERSIAATKTYTTQLAASLLLATELATVEGAEVSEIRQGLFSLPKYLRETLQDTNAASKRMAPIMAKGPVAFVLGTGPNYPTALEGALKLRETANMFVQGFAAREFLHGPIQLVSSSTPVVVMEPSKMPMVLKRMGGYGPPTIPVGPGEQLPVEYIGPEELHPIPYAAVMQFLALHTSLARDLDPDRPQKLRKVVR